MIFLVIRNNMAITFDPIPRAHVVQQVQHRGPSCRQSRSLDFFSQCFSSQACLSHRLSGPSRPTFEITHRPFGLGSPNAPAVIATPLPDEAVAYRPASPASLRYQSMMEGIQNSAGRKTATYRPMASVIYILNMRGWGGAVPGTPPPPSLHPSPCGQHPS